MPRLRKVSKHEVSSPTRRCRSSASAAAARTRAVAVGEDITCPPQIASGGVIRVRSERAAQVARWFGLGRHDVAPGPSSIDAKAASDARAPRGERAASSSASASASAAASASSSASASASASASSTLSGPTSSASTSTLFPAPILRPGTITLITGPSGAGKSTLLRAARAAHPRRRWIDLVAMDAPDAPLVDCFDDLPLRDALALLARVGLGEAWTYLRTPAELSDGQRWRFRLALALHAAAQCRRAPHEGVKPFARDAAERLRFQTESRSRARTESRPDAANESRPPDAANAIAASPTSETRDDDRPVIACDEFAAVLDRVTAMIVAHRLRRAIDALPHAAAVVATSHDDLEPALAAEVIVRCDFGRYEEFRSTNRHE